MSWSSGEISNAGQALELMSGKWVLPILRILAERPHRPRELQTALGNGSGEASGKVIYETLERLSTRGLVTREESATGPGPYVLTARGRAALRISSQAGEPIRTAGEALSPEGPARPSEEGFMSQDPESGNRSIHPVDISRTEEPVELDSTTPSAARMYDYYLGGKNNFAVDRDRAEEVLTRVPEIGPALRNNRAFLHRIVRYLARAGITQFIELGSGVPTSPNVHEIAQAVHLGTRVVYVDNDPVVLAHDRALLSGDSPNVVTINADICDPEDVLARPGLQRLIDFDRPVAVLLVAVLHFISGDAQELVAAYTRGLASGSYLAVSHGVSDGNDPHAIHEIRDIYSTASSPAVFRTKAQVRELFDGLDLLAPGLVDVTAWHPTPETTAQGAGWYVGALARKP